MCIHFYIQLQNLFIQIRWFRTQWPNKQQDYTKCSRFDVRCYYNKNRHMHVNFGSQRNGVPASVCQSTCFQIGESEDVSNDEEYENVFSNAKWIHFTRTFADQENTFRAKFITDSCFPCVCVTALVSLFVMFVYISADCELLAASENFSPPFESMYGWM